MNIGNTNALPSIDTLWNHDDPKGTETKFRELIPKAKKLADQTYYAELLTQLARTQSLQRKFAEAYTLLDSAEKIITGTMIIPTIRYHLERGRTYNSAGRKPEASEQFLTAYKIAIENAQDFYLVDAAHMLGISEKPEEQVRWNLKAIEEAEKSKDLKTRKWLGSLYNNIGWTFHDLKQYDKALHLFNKALAWREEQKDAKRAFIAKWTIGRTYRSLNKIDDALNIQMDLLGEIEEGKSGPGGYIYEEIGECLLTKGEPERAKSYFIKAYVILSNDRWLQANEKERLDRLKKLGV